MVTQRKGLMGRMGGSLKDVAVAKESQQTSERRHKVSHFSDMRMRRGNFMTEFQVSIYSSPLLLQIKMNIAKVLKFSLFS